MSRLTKKNETVLGGYSLVASALGSDVMAKSLSKLGKLENIEDELGIDLITLFKALEQGHIWVKFDKPFITYEYELTINREEKCFYVKTRHKNGFNLDVVWLYDYGKTWALTKEELS